MTDEPHPNAAGDPSARVGTVPIAPDDVRRRLIGIALVIASAAMFAVVDGLSKLLADTQSVAQIVWARYALALPFLLALTPRTRWRAMFKTARPALQLWRGVTPLGVSVAMVLAVRYLPLAEATVILFAAPFLVLALSAPFLGERVHASSWIAVAVGFAAVLLVARPGFGELSRYAIFPLAAAIFFAAYQLLTRRLGAAGEPARTTLAWTLAVGAVVATPLAALSWMHSTPTAWLLMAALGAAFWLAQMTMVEAYTRATAGLLAPFAYAQIVAATVIGVLVFDALPDVWTFLGIATIIAAGVYVARNQTA